MGLLVAAALIGASGSAAKEFGPGDLRVCDAARCPIMNRDAVRGALPLLLHRPAAGGDAAAALGRTPSSCASRTATRRASPPERGSTGF